jgi:hypothetical protein
VQNKKPRKGADEHSPRVERSAEHSPRSIHGEPNDGDADDMHDDTPPPGQ